MLISDEELAACAESQLVDSEATPHRLFLAPIARANYASVSAAATGSKLLPAYSVKTNPRPEMLQFAHEFGFLAEVISPDEYALARSIGFPPERIVYNGPFPLEGEQALIAFADSVEAFERYTAEGTSIVAGIRFRPAQLDSRFGIARDGLLRCADIARRATASSVALHFHVRPEDYGGRSWFEIANDALRAASEFAGQCSKPLSYFDVGGGWEPASLDRALNSALPRFLEKASAELPDLQHVIIEPGQGIATPVEAVVTRVLEVRRRHGFSEAIVDSGYPDLPQAHTFAHRIFHVRDRRVTRLPAGPDRVSGSTCLEYDVLSESVKVDGTVSSGDLLIIADAGAYDASMCFSFAHGERSGAA